MTKVEEYVNARMAEVDLAGVALSEAERSQLETLLRSAASITKPIARVGAIARLSDDKREGAGNLRQIKDILDCAVRNRLNIVEFFIDTDRSASRFATRKRERYGEAREALLSGALDGLVAYNLDRIWRRPREAEEIFERVLAGRAVLWSAQGLQLDSADAVFQARLLVSVAANESEAISRRTKRSMETAALRGVPHGGTVPYGRSRIRDDRGRAVGPWQTDQAEADVIREACSRILEGEGLATIAADLNRRGIPTRRGGPWRHTTLRSAVTAAHVAGLRAWTPTSVEEGRRLRGQSTSIVQSAVLEPIVDESVYRQVLAVLADPLRTTTSPRGGHERRWLAPGFLVCGKCGGSMGSKSGRSKKGELIHSYACRECKRVRRKADNVDEFLAAGVIEMLSTMRGDDVPGRPAVEEAQAALAIVRQQRADLDNQLAAGRISVAAYSAGFDALAARESEAASVLQAGSTAPKPRLPTGRAELEALWHAAGLNERRAIVAASGIEVVVSGVGKGRHHPPFAGMAIRRRTLPSER